MPICHEILTKHTHKCCDSLDEQQMKTKDNITSVTQYYESCQPESVTEKYDLLTLGNIKMILLSSDISPSDFRNNPALYLQVDQ